MIVGAAVVELHVHDSDSLKAKRGVVRSIVGRVRSRFAVSVAEVGGQDTWQRAVIGLATVGHDARHVRALLERAIAFVEGLGLAEVTDSDVEILRLPVRDAAARWTDDEARGDGAPGDRGPGDPDDDEED